MLAQCSTNVSTVFAERLTNPDGSHAKKKQLKYYVDEPCLLFEPFFLVSLVICLIFSKC